VAGNKCVPWEAAYRPPAVPWYNDAASMSQNNPEITAAPEPGWARKWLVPLAGLLIVIAVSVGIFYFYRQYPERIKELQSYSYLGAFVIGLLFNATVVLPTGGVVVLIALGATMPFPGPIFVGLTGGTGAALGEIMGYIAGRSGRSLLARGDMYHRVERWVQRWGGLTIFLASVFPFVFDLVGIAAGAARYSFSKFLLYCWLGRMLLYVVLVSLAALGLKTVAGWF
jgi:membrane protein DedA with SNARE-associated domain